jgi:DNA-directed RNA polymerase subunit beta
VYSKINNLGFIETPYRQVNAGKVDVKADVIYLSAEEEDNKMIAQANAKVNDKGEFDHQPCQGPPHGRLPRGGAQGAAPDGRGPRTRSRPSPHR